MFIRSILNLSDYEKSKISTGLAINFYSLYIRQIKKEKVLSNVLMLVKKYFPFNPQSLTNPKGLHVFRKSLSEKTYDPSRGRTPCIWNFLYTYDPSGIRILQ